MEDAGWKQKIPGGIFGSANLLTGRRPEITCNLLWRWVGGHDSDSDVMILWWKEGTSLSLLTLSSPEIWGFSARPSRELEYQVDAICIPGGKGQ